MCVTNTTHRRSQGFSLTPTSVQSCSNAIPECLMGFAAQEQTRESPFPGFSNPKPTSSKLKPCPKRRRKPQKPGLTAKQNERHFVVHNYHDHANDSDENDVGDIDDAHRRGGVSAPFPIKLHQVLDQVEADGLAHVVSWQPHGRCFVIHRPQEFVEHVMPLYFRQSKLTSFQRQLNLYGYNRLTRGLDAGGYYHELFLRGKLFLCNHMTRTKVKGTKFKAASSPEYEPSFYEMPPVVVVSPWSTSDEENFPASASQSSYDSLSNHHAEPVVSGQNLELFPIQYASLNVDASALSRNSYAMLEADRVLDEAVEELFMNDCGNDDLIEFFHDWDPNCSDLAEPVNDDFQLGLMLETLLA